MPQERRRAPRYEIPTGELAVMPVSLSVRVLDLSPGGALLQANQPVKAGSRGHLRMSLGGRPLSLAVEIRRSTLGTSGNGYRIGLMFVDISADYRQIIESFTRGAERIQ